MNLCSAFQLPLFVCLSSLTATLTLHSSFLLLLFCHCLLTDNSVTLTIRKLEQEILASGHSLLILTTLSGDSNNTHLDGQHPNRQVIFMDNAKPIPFLHDPNDPELTYQVGFNLSPAVKAQIDNFEPSIIHITVPDCTALHLVEYARQKELPIMGTYHSNIPEYMDHYPGLSWLKPILGSFFRHQYNFMQALYVPTPFIQKHLQDNWQLEKATKLGVWGRGVDIEKFHPHHRLDQGGQKFRSQLGLDPATPIVTWVGRLVPEKRVDIFCDTVRRLHQQGLDFHAVVIGAGPCEEEIRGLPKTTFCGWMSAEQLAVAYASSDVFLFPSSVETFGNVTLEAMASGLPVVVEAGCSGHLVEEGVNGYAIEAGDATGFFEATADLVRDADKRNAFRQASRAKAEMLEKRTVVRQMLQNYQTLTQEFYTEHGGRHANRDAQWSFKAGNHPRPVLLVAVEYLFIVLFQVLWNMSQMVVWVQEAIVKRRGGAAVVATANTVALEDATATPEEEVPQPTKPASSKSMAAAPQNANQKGCCSNTSVAMAVSFIRMMELICRLESMARNGTTRAWQCPRGVMMRIKRKKSFDNGHASDVETVKELLPTSSLNGSRHGKASQHTIRTRQRGGSSSGGLLLEAMDSDSPLLSSSLEVV